MEAWIDKERVDAPAGWTLVLEQTVESSHVFLRSCRGSTTTPVALAPGEELRIVRDNHLIATFVEHHGLATSPTEVLEAQVCDAVV